MKRFSRNILWLAPVAAFAMAAPASYAQQTQASLTGQVLDPTGARIPGAEVTITDQGTSISRVVQSNASGRYSVTNLNPGTYQVAVKSAGFTGKVEKDIVLQVGQDGSLDVTLQPGASGEVVTVEAAASLTQTEDSSQGSVIDNKEVVGLPLNQRTFYSLATLSPAAYLPGQSSTLGFRGGFNVAGNNETANTFTINGIDDNDQNVMAPSFRPSVEAIEEFKLLTGVYSAEYGRTSGGQVVVVTKRGTNALHGDVFEFLRNSQFDAKNAFTLPGQPTTFRRNQFGGTVGGPIVKDKAFFFLSYEGLRLAQPVVANAFVPNPAFLNGDFSSVTAQLHNPVTGAAYLNNQIPVSSFDPIGKAILQLYPAPNTAVTNLAVDPYTFNAKRIENLDEGSARVDYKLTQKDDFLLQYNYFNDPSLEPSLSLCSSGVLPSAGCIQNQISTLASINETHIVSAHWLNEIRLGFDRLEQPRIGTDNSNTNFPKVPGAFLDPHIPANLLGGAPTTTVTGYSSTHPYSNLPQHRWDDHFNLVDNVSYTRGNHNFKFGTNLLQARYSDLYVADSTGIFTFTGTVGSTKNLTTGNAAADLALGFAATATRSPTAPDIHVRYNALGFFAQDDWKVTPRLTLNLGVRYEDFLPIHDTRNILSNWLYPTAANPNGTIQVAGQAGSGTSVFSNDGNNFAPRVGLAYEVFGDAKTVFHASYGIFYNSPAIGNGADLSLGLNVPFRLTQAFTSTNTAQSVLSTNPFPVSGTAQNGTQAAPYTSVAPTGIDPNFRTLYLDEYGADIQQQLTPTISLTIGYIGNQGVRIPRNIQPNQGINRVPTFTAGNPYPTNVTSTRPYTTNTPASNSGPIPNPLALGSNNPGGGGPLYVQYSNITEYVSVGHSSFNALTVKGQKSIGNGISFILAYTWGKSIDNTPGYASGSQASSGTPQNSFNLQGERGLSDFNVQNRIALSPVIELPFGKNKTYFNNGLMSNLLGGFQLSGVYQYDSGRPFTIAENQNRSGSVYGVDRPNLIGNPNNGPKTRNQFFNTAAFTVSQWGTFGNEGRNAVIGPSYQDVDIALQRRFAISERYSVALRFEAFNLANKVNYLNPLGTSTGEYINSSNDNFGTLTPSGACSTAVGQRACNTSATFGQLTQANDPRSLQFSGKFFF